MNKRATLLTVLLLIVFGVGLVAPLLPLSDHYAPDVELVLFDGKKTSLRELRGRPVLVNFWATRCTPCVEELPDLIQLYRDLHARGFELIAVAAPYDPPIQIQAFAQNHTVPYPIALDLEGQVARAFGGVPYVPTAFLIDPEGKIVYQKVGKLDMARARRIILKSLAAGKSSP